MFERRQTPAFSQTFSHICPFFLTLSLWDTLVELVDVLRHLQGKMGCYMMTSAFSIKSVIHVAWHLNVNMLQLDCGGSNNQKGLTRN